jgi:hypothetical protein
VSFLAIGFMAGSVAHAAGAVLMDMEMSASDSPSTAPGDCKACASADSQPVCGNGCVMPIHATVETAHGYLRDGGTEAIETVTTEVLSRTETPEPDPPRTVILS